MGRSEESKKKNALNSLRYHRENLRQYNLSLNRITEADLIAHLETKQPYATYIKSLIKEDMKKN